MGIFLPDTQIEILNPKLTPGQVRCALFDFDGTLSLIRQGWQGIMIPMMVEVLLATPAHEDEETLFALVTEFVERLTGRQTIYQMIQLCQEVEKRGGHPEGAASYKHSYHRLLMAHIHSRRENLASGQVARSELMVPGALEILKEIKTRNIVCYLASGTDEAYVIEEAQLLGITEFFAGIYGAQEDYKRFSKRKVIDYLLTQAGWKGSELVIFGDGYIEIQEARERGTIAIGVASQEVTRNGIDEWKRKRLIEAGADLIIPDFREQAHLLAFLLDEKVEPDR